MNQKQNPGTTELTVILGIDEDQSPVVANTAARLASQLGAKVLCVNVQSGRLTTQRLPHHTSQASPADGFDDGNEPDNVLPQGLHHHLEQVFAAAGVSWEAREVEGDPSKALAQIAQEQDAVMIVVGTRRPGIRSKIEELVDGSVAVALAHRQSLPVLVVPQVSTETGQLPWED